MLSSLAAELGIETIEMVGPPKKSRSTQLEDNFCPSPSKSSEESVSNESDDDEPDVEFIGYIIIESYIKISLVAPRVALEFSKSRKPKLLCYNTQFTCIQGYTNTR
jgi:hypothetical protein